MGDEKYVTGVSEAPSLRAQSEAVDSSWSTGPVVGNDIILRNHLILRKISEDLRLQEDRCGKLSFRK